MKLTIHGHVPSKKNSKRLFLHGSRPVLVSSKAYEAWHTIASYELMSQIKGMANRICASGPYRIEIEMFAKTRAKNDLTNKAESIMDLLVDNGVIPDDNWNDVPQILLSYGGLDAKNPRAEISMYRKEGDQTYGIIGAPATKVGKQKSKKS